MHKWISTDYGSQCYRCGIVLDYLDPENVQPECVGA